MNELLDRGGEAGDVVVNLHAQLNMLGGLMVILVGLALSCSPSSECANGPRRARFVRGPAAGGMAVYYAAGIGLSALAAHRVAGGETYGHAVAALEPWQALVLVPAALAVLAGFGAFAAPSGAPTAPYRDAGRRAVAAVPSIYTGRIPKRVRRRSPAAIAAYELPMGLLGFPGVGWLFAGFPFTADDPPPRWAGRCLGAHPPRLRRPTPTFRSRGWGSPRSSSGYRRAPWSRPRFCTAPSGGDVSGCSVPRLAAPPARRRLPDACERRPRRHRPAARIAPVRPGCDRHRRELGSLLVPDGIHARGHGAVPRFPTRHDQALRLA